MANWRLLLAFVFMFTTSVDGVSIWRADPQVDGSVRLGANFMNYRDSTGVSSYQRLAGYGLKQDRVTFNMSAIWPSPSRFDWLAYDALVSEARGEGVEILAVLIVPSRSPNGDPYWACRDEDLGKGFCVPRLAEWTVFVSQIVSRYRLTILTWEIWNEPNLEEFFGGSPEDFAGILRIAFTEIKTRQPSAVVVLGGIYRGVNLDRTQALFDAIALLPDAAEHNFYHDAIGFHSYDGGHCSEFDELSYIKQVAIVPTVGDKPIWITESGIIVSKNMDSNALESESRSFLLTTFTYGQFHSVQRHYVFRAVDTPAESQTGENWGLLTYSGNARQQLDAVSIIKTYFPSNFDWAERTYGSGGLNVTYRFHKSDLGTVSVTWGISTSSSTARVPSERKDGIAILVNQFGQRARISSRDGVFEVPLLPAQNFRWSHPEGICRVGSPPIIVIEAEHYDPIR